MVGSGENLKIMHTTKSPVWLTVHIRQPDWKHFSLYSNSTNIYLCTLSQKTFHLTVVLVLAHTVSFYYSEPCSFSVFRIFLVAGLKKNGLVSVDRSGDFCFLYQLFAAYIYVDEMVSFGYSCTIDHQTFKDIAVELK